MDIYEPLYLLHLYDVYLSPELYLYFFSQLPNFDVLFIKIARLNSPPPPHLQDVDGPLVLQDVALTAAQHAQDLVLNLLQLLLVLSALPSGK